MFAGLLRLAAEKAKKKKKEDNTAADAGGDAAMAEPASRRYGADG